MQNIINIPNALYHVFLHGYFEHAYQVYFSKLHKEGNSDALQETQTLALQKQLFESILSKLKGDTFISPNLISLTTHTRKKEGFYPFSVHFTPDEKFWFELFLNIKFSELQRLTKKYYTLNKSEIPKNLYSELLKSFQTPKAIEFMREKTLKELKK